jgi:hypothetical protein
MVPVYSLKQVPQRLQRYFCNDPLLLRRQPFLTIQLLPLTLCSLQDLLGQDLL